MRARLNRIRLRDLALFVVVAGVVAVAVVIAGREAGVGERAGAGDDSTTEVQPFSSQSAADTDAAPQSANSSSRNAAAGQADRVATESRDQASDEATESLVVTLSAPDTCETTRARGYAGSQAVRDDDGVPQRNADGSWKYESVPTGWAGVAEVEVTWTVIAGTAPYTLEIDGEMRDASGAYEGAGGTASVS